MEFELGAFVEELRREMYIHFPWEYNKFLNEKKHPNRSQNIRDVAFMDNKVIAIDNTLVFDIGNAYAEEIYPYYHILQDAPVIRKRGKGTDKTKGSQRGVKNLGQRDYAKVSFNGKTYSKEYAKNVRGVRKSVVERATQWKVDESSGGLRKVYESSLSYRNIHYKYIDKILDTSIPIVAHLFGGTMGKSRNTGLEDDYNESIRIENMLDSFV